MDAQKLKLAMKLRDPELAEKLVRAGFDNPAKLRAASDKQLKAVSGVGQSALDKIRKKFKRR